ncbi:MAG: hydroxyethylthiazole kinase, partial [Lachnospiraceae bacterium]|nr:hydroxyethylthiazole kinase [Lachnospiraceae bacterium]
MIEQVRKQNPRVHCITNYVTAGSVANFILASGGSPIMASGAREVEEVTAICDSLIINLGTLDEAAVPAMILAGKKAAGLGHPVILDPVGVGASGFRLK